MTHATITKQHTNGRRPHRGRSLHPGRALAEERSERLALDAARRAAPEALDAYRRLFRAALLQAVEEVGSPVSSASLVLGFSRAALRTWNLTKAHPFDRERVRLEVLAEVQAEFRAAPLRAGLTPGDPDPVGAPVGLIPEPLVVPRGRAVEGEHPRRSGSRR